MGKTIYKTIIAMGFSFFVSHLAYGQAQQATFVAVKGDVKHLKKPSSPEDEKAPQAVYEGETYVWHVAKIGRKANPHDVIQTGPNGQAKLIFSNGDHFAVGSGTSFTIPSVADAKSKEPSKLNMFYGKIRAMVSKGGPRSNMEIKTITATAGVRGTDFFISESGNNGCKITVLRGQVSVRPDKEIAATANTKPLAVNSGYTAHLKGAVDPKSNKLGQIKADLKEATKEHLLDVQASSRVEENLEDIQTLPSEQKTEIHTLKESALNAVLNDIKGSDPKFYKKIKAEKVTEVEEVNAMVVSKLYSGAPAEDPKRKPTKEEIESLGQDVYKKYFKPAK